MVWPPTREGGNETAATKSGEGSAPVARGALRLPLPGVATTWAARTFSSLEHRNFRYLWLGMLALMGGMNMQIVARAQLAWDLSGSAIMVAIVGAGMAPPILVLSNFGGALADRVNRKRVIQAGQLASMVIALTVALLIVTERIALWHLVAASVLQGFSWAFLMPSRQAIIPELVGKERTSNAVALNASAMSLMTLVAPGIAGVMYARVGVGATFFTIAALSLLAFVLTERLPNSAGRGSTPRRKEPMLREMKEGIQYTLRNRTVLVLLALALSTTILAQPFRSLMPVFVHDVYGRGPEAVGLLLSMIGLGALLGTLAIAGLRKGELRGAVLLATTALSGLALVLATTTAIYGVAVFVMVLLGVGDSGRRSLNSALMLEEADEPYRGRVMGLYMMNFGLIPLGAIPLAAISEAVGIRYAVAGAGMLLMVTAVATTLATNRVRRL
ncbi:MAG: MFS transporter [Chloroflexi bacterium]|nr:MFS transporter [Chloroflexota bacterium]